MRHRLKKGFIHKVGLNLIFYPFFNYNKRDLHIKKTVSEYVSDTNFLNMIKEIVIIVSLYNLIRKI